MSGLLRMMVNLYGRFRQGDRSKGEKVKKKVRRIRSEKINVKMRVGWGFLGKQWKVPGQSNRDRMDVSFTAVKPVCQAKLRHPFCSAQPDLVVQTQQHEVG
jgi:hypothetical protein